MVIYVLVKVEDIRLVPSVKVFRCPEQAIEAAGAPQYEGLGVKCLQNNGVFMLCDSTIYRKEI